LVVLLACLPVALNCECDSGSEITADEALANRFYLGASAQAPGIDQFGNVQAGSQPEEGIVQVDFGAIDVNTLATRYLFVKNTGNANLNIVGVDFEPGSDPAFAVACQRSGLFEADCPYAPGNVLAIGPNGDLIVQISYAPQQVGQHAGAFLISSNANDYPFLRVELAGQGVTPEIQVCISDCQGDQQDAACQAASELCNDVVDGDLQVDFGDLEVGQSRTRRVWVRNLGDQALDVTQLQLNGGDLLQFSRQVAEGDLPGTIAPGGQAIVEVIYQPGTGGQHATALEILSSDINESEVQVQLVGRGLAPRVCPDPLSIDFGNVAVGEPRTESFQLTNCGLLDLTLEGVGLSAVSSADFSLVAPPATPLVLAPGESTVVQVQYDPDARGSDTGGVEIFSNDPASDPVSHLSGTVALRGNGIVRECQMQATPFTLNFGGVVVAQSDSMILMISNQGNDNCTFRGAEITANSNDNEFSILAQPPADTEFGPGEILQVEVLYAPTALEVDQGLLTITGTDVDGPTFDVPLVGEGVATAECELTLKPGLTNFGITKAATTRPLFVTLKNEGNAVCHVDRVQVAQVGFQVLFPGDFSITAGPQVPFVVARRGQPGSQVDIEVTFAPEPNNMGLHSATFYAHTTDMATAMPMDPLVMGICRDPNNPMVPEPPGGGCSILSGTAAESDIEVVPSELDFGVVTVGCNSPELHVTVYNLGTYELNVEDIYLEDPADPNFEIRQAPAVPFVLAGGASFQVRLRYHPQDTNVHRSALYIVSDASNEQMYIVPLFGRGTLISDQTDVFHQLDQVKSDVLFVVDNSGSMGWAQNELSSNFSSFINWAVNLDVDYHIGVITTEVNDPESGEGDPPRDIFPGVLVFAPNRPKIITNATPNLQTAFSENVHVGTCCSDEQEAGLEAAWMALSEPLVSDPTANAGFLREDAKLYIICISDEQDQSRGNPDFYVDFFSSIKGYRNTDMMKVSAIVGDAPSGCGTDTAESGSRYIEVANRTGGIFQSICTGNWAQALENLGIDAFAAIREFPLSRPADEATISVTVNGQPVAHASCNDPDNPSCQDGWIYDPGSNTIYFGDEVVPDRGDRIEVDYTAVCFP
jgi:hypothetical protein